jgi:hypothetical protein
VFAITVVFGVFLLVTLFSLYCLGFYASADVPAMRLYIGYMFALCCVSAFVSLVVDAFVFLACGYVTARNTICSWAATFLIYGLGEFLLCNNCKTWLDYHPPNVSDNRTPPGVLFVLDGFSFLSMVILPFLLLMCGVLLGDFVHGRMVSLGRVLHLVASELLEPELVVCPNKETRT